MYYIQKTMEVAGAHNLTLNYESKCSNIHGHNWKIVVYCKAMALDENGMVIDFKKVQEIVKDKIDHKYLNTEFGFNPTAENIARWIVENVDSCYKAEVNESEGNKAIYEL